MKDIFSSTFCPPVNNLFSFIRILWHFRFYATRKTTWNLVASILLQFCVHLMHLSFYSRRNVLVPSKWRHFRLIWFRIKFSRQNCCTDESEAFQHAWVSTRNLKQLVVVNSHSIAAIYQFISAHNFSLNQNWIEFIICDNKLHSHSAPFGTMNGVELDYKYHANIAQCK